jgi:hypothetical protein
MHLPEPMLEKGKFKLKPIALRGGDGIFIFFINII